MFKKIFSLFLVVVMMLGMTVNAIAADSDIKNTNAVNLLEMLQVIFEKNDFEYESAVSRADFAVYAARVLGIDDTVSDTETRYYIDMATYDYAAYSVNTLVERGILSVGEDKLFRPSDAVTYEEAVKMVICMLGYKPAAEARGGYPAGYLRVASQLDLDYGNNDQIFSLNEAAVLFSGALISPQYVVNSVMTENGESTYGYYESYENTLMYEVFGYKFAEGILTGYDEINIAFDVTASENNAVVDGISYAVKEGLDLTDMIGSNVCVLFDKNDVIQYAYTEPVSEKIIEVDVEDFVSYDGSKFVYNEGDKPNKTLNVESAVVIYNGAAPEANVYGLFSDLESGSIKLVNSDGKGAVDAIVVTDYRSFVYKSMDKANNILFSKRDGEPGIELDKYARVEIVDSNGNAVETSALEENNVLNVVAAGDYSRIKIIVTTTNVNGVVSELKTGSEARVTVGDKSYEFNRRYRSIAEEVTTGQTAKFLINAFGEIVMLDDSLYENMKIGYLSGLSLGSAVFDTGLRFRIFSKESGVVTYSSADNIRVDGIKYDSAKSAANNIPDTVCDGNSIQFKSQIILYKLNSENEITHIDTHRVSSEENPELTLSRLTDGTTSVTKYSGRFDKKYPVNSNTDIYCVPQEENLSSNPSDYSIAKENRFNNTVSFKMELYKTKGSNEFVDAALYHMNSSDTEINDWLNSNIYLVGGISDAIDKNSEPYKMISGLMQGSEKNLEIYESDLLAESEKIDNLSEGDLIRFRTAQSGRIIHIQKIYDMSDGKRINWNADTDTTSLFETGFTNNFNISFGFVNNVGKKVVSWGYKAGNTVDEAVDLSSMKVMFYDKNQRDGMRLYTGTIDSVIDYESAGDKCDIILVQTSQSHLRSVVVYKQ